MIIGSPTGTEKPTDHTVTGQSVETEPDDDGGNQQTESESSALTRLIEGARTVSEILAPFTAFASSIVHLITAYKFFSHA